MNTPKSLFFKNMIAFILGMLLIGFQKFHDTHQIQYLFIGGYILLSLYHAWQFGMKHYGNLFSVVIFWFLPFALVFAVFVSLSVGFLTSVPRWFYSAYQSYKHIQTRHQPVYRNSNKNVIAFRAKSQ